MRVRNEVIVNISICLGVSKNPRIISNNLYAITSDLVEFLIHICMLSTKWQKETINLFCSAPAYLTTHVILGVVDEYLDRLFEFIFLKM